MSKKQEQKPASKVEEYLTSVETAPKPWFLNSSTVYKLVKDSLISAPVSKSMFESSVQGLTMLTEFINSKTKAGIAVLDVERSYELLTDLDGLLADQCVYMDDGLDDYRSKLAVGLRKLIASVLDHKLFLEKYVSENVSNAQNVAHTRYEQVLKMLEGLLDYVHKKYPQTYERLTSAASTGAQQVTAKASEYRAVIDNSVTTVQQTVSAGIETAKARVVQTHTAVDAKIVATAEYVLKTAQPYVHEAVNRSTPIIAQAVEISTPYVERAIPYIQAIPYYEPIVNKTSSVGESILENERVIPYVKKALSLFEDAKLYCLPSTTSVDSTTTTEVASVPIEAAETIEETPTISAAAAEAN